MGDTDGHCWVAEEGGRAIQARVNAHAAAEGKRLWSHWLGHEPVDTHYYQVPLPFPLAGDRSTKVDSITRKNVYQNVIVTSMLPLALGPQRISPNP